MNTEQIIVLVISLVVLVFGVWAVRAQGKDETLKPSGDLPNSTNDSGISKVVE